MNTELSTLHRVPLWLSNLTAFCVMVTLCVAITYTEAVHAIALSKKTRAEAVSRIEPSVLPYNPYSDDHITAHAAVVMNLHTGTVLFAKNEHAQLPLASITKLMTGLVALEKVPAYTSVPVSLYIGDEPKIERWKLTDLVDYTLISSSNAGASAIASLVGTIIGNNARTDSDGEQVFVDAMNQAASQLRLSQTYFLNPTGLDESEQISGAYGSAYDVAQLLSYIRKHAPELLSETVRTSVTFTTLDNLSVTARNTNSAVDRIPGLVGSKTGLTDLAGGNLAVLFDASFNQPYAVVVLGSTEDDRFTDVETLVSSTIEFLGLRGQLFSSTL